jgi:hypothetical protein
LVICCIADWKSARDADCQSATPQTVSLRYGGYALPETIVPLMRAGFQTLDRREIHARRGVWVVKTQDCSFQTGSFGSIF